MNLNGCSIVWMNIYGWGWYVRYHEWISMNEVEMNRIKNEFLWMILEWISMDEVWMNGIMFESLRMWLEWISMDEVGMNGIMYESLWMWL